MFDVRAYRQGGLPGGNSDERCGMKTIIGLLIAGVLGFYVAWPAYTGYRIKTALDTDNADLLAAKIDFDRVRTSLRPAVTTEVEKAMTAAIRQGGADNEPLLQQLKTQLMPRVIETALTTVVTPESVLRIHREGGNYKATLAKIIAEKAGSGLGALGGEDAAGLGRVIGRLGRAAEAAGFDPGKALGGLLGNKGPAPAPAPDSGDGAAAAPRKSFGLANIKRFAMNGPLGYSVGIARDAASSEPDVTADIAFTGGDWKVVGIRPRV